MKHSLLPKGTAVFREAQAPPAYDSTPPPKSQSSSKKQGRCKENSPPPDPNSMGSDKKALPVAAAKARCPLPPRPPCSNPLKQKLSADAVVENAPAGASDTGVKIVVRMRPQNHDEEEGGMIVQKVSTDSVTINGSNIHIGCCS